MDDSDHRPSVSVIGVIIAFLIPLAVAGLVAVLLAQAGPHHVRLAGVPLSELESMRVASKGEAAVSVDSAIEAARTHTSGTLDGRVRDVALGRYREEPLYAFSGRLVWVVSFVPDKLSLR